MNEDEDVSAKPAHLSSPPLDRLGVDELQAYIAGLRSEITRAEAEITRKQGLRSAADSVFRRP